MRGPKERRTSENSVKAKFPKRTMDKIQALWSCTLRSPFPVSKARKYRTGGLPLWGARLIAYSHLPNSQTVWLVAFEQEIAESARQSLEQQKNLMAEQVRLNAKFDPS